MDKRKQGIAGLRAPMGKREPIRFFGGGSADTSMSDIGGGYGGVPSFDFDIAGSIGAGGLPDFGPGGLGGRLGIPAGVNYDPNVGGVIPGITPSGAVLIDLLGKLQSGQYTYGDAGAARDSGLITPEQHAIFTDAFNQYTGTAPGQRPYAAGETVTGPYTPPATTTTPTTGGTTTTPTTGGTTTTPAIDDTTTAPADGGAVLTDLLGQLESGQYVYGDASKARDSGLITPEQHAVFTEAFNEYTGTAPGQRPYSVGETVTGPYTPPDTTTTPEQTETTSSATAGTVPPAGSRTYAGIPQEILDRIEVGIELPIPGPGNMPLPIIFGSVQDFIDWVQSVGIDPTTGNPDDFLGTLGRVVGDIYSTATDAFKGAVQGATTGQTRRFQDFVRDMILAGQTDAGTIVNAAQDAGIIPSGGGGAPSAGTPPGTTPTGGTTGPGTDIGLPGGEEEDEDEGAAPAGPEGPQGPAGADGRDGVDGVDGRDGVDGAVGPQGPIGPQGPEGPQGPAGADAPPFDDSAINERLDELGTNQDEVLGKLDDAIAQGSTNEDAIQQVADELGTTKEDLLGALGTTEDNLIDRMDQLEANLEGRITDTESSILDQVLANEEAGMARDDALNDAIDSVASDLGMTRQELLDAIGATESTLSDQISGVEANLEARIGDAESNILDEVRANEEAGMARDDALNDAIDTVADDLGMTRDELLGEIGATRDDLRDEIGASEQRLGTQMTDIGRQIGLRDLLGTLSEPGVLSQQVDVGEAELADIGDLYSFESIFRTPEQEARFATPYAEGGEVEAGYSALESAHPRIQAEALALAEEFGLDPEMVAANMMMGDLEFQADVAPHFGPFGQAENIDPSRARMIPGSRPLVVRQSGGINSLLGFQVPENIGDKALEDRQELIDAYARMEGVEPVTIERDMVYGVGAGGATPETFAHEFRHRAFNDVPFDRFTEENLQDFLDMMYSSDPQHYDVKSRSYTGGDFPGDADSLMGEFLEGEPTAMGRVIGELVLAGKVNPNDLYPEQISMLEEFFGTSEPTAEELMRRLRAPENTARGRMTRAKYRDNK